MKLHYNIIILMLILLFLLACGDLEHNKTSAPRYALEVRDISIAASSGYETEYDNKQVAKTLLLSKSSTAIILMDVWADHINEGLALRLNDNVRGYLSPLLEAARDAGLLIIHTPHLKGTVGYTYHPLVQPLPGEIVIESGQADLNMILKFHGIETLMYAGYASNMCILNRDTGIHNMKALGYRIVFIRDASIAFELPVFGLFGDMHKWATVFIEDQYGTSTLVSNVISWLQD